MDEKQVTGGAKDNDGTDDQVFHLKPNSFYLTK